MQERQQRVPFTRPVFIAPIQGPGRSHRLLTGNISEGGMFVRSDARFDPGTPVSVSLEARGQVFPFAQGEVIWDADAERLPTTGGLPGFGIKFTGFLNEGSPALLSHLVYRGPGVNVSDHLTNQLGGDAPIPAAAPEVPTLPMDFMSMPLDELGDAEPEVEWPEGIVLPDAITREPVQADVASRPSFRLDLEGERAEMAPAEPAAVTPDQARRVAIGTAVAIGVLIVASVLLLRSRNDTPATDAGAPQQFEAMDLT
ncbi:MAG: PilZ domain-containing protein, partial [Myxococcaceae bacterium]